MEVSALVPIGAAIVGAAALLLAGDLLTVKGRLRRKLDKELAIADRLPAGGKTRKDMEELVRRHALELFYRECHENAAPLALVIASLVGLTVGLGNLVYLSRNPDIAEGADWFNTYVLPWFFVLFFPLALVVRSQTAHARREYVQSNAAPTLPRLLGARRQVIRRPAEPTTQAQRSALRRVRTTLQIRRDSDRGSDDADS